MTKIPKDEDMLKQGASSFGIFYDSVIVLYCFCFLKFCVL